MTSGAKGIIFLDHNGPGINIKIIKLFDNRNRFRVAHNLYARIPQHNLPEGGAVVRLHVVHHHVI